MGKLKYILYTIAAALMAAATSIKNSADNVPATLDADTDGVIAGTTGNESTLVNVNAPAVDGAGLPWDERIHASTKSIKADGTWTKRKGATPPVVAAVEAELRAKQGNAPVGNTVALTLPTPGVILPAIGGLAVPGALTPVPLTEYQKLVAYLAAKTGPGKAADDAWVTAAFTSWGLTLAGLATDEANATLALAQFKAVLGE